MIKSSLSNPSSLPHPAQVLSTGITKSQSSVTQLSSAENMEAAVGMHLPNPSSVLNPDDNKTGELLGWSITMFVLSGLAVPLRFISLWLVRRGSVSYHLADWLVLASLPFAWASNAIVIWGASHDGYGRHIGSSTFEQLRSFLVGLWVFELVYCWALSLARLSLIALWWRVFHHCTASYVVLIITAALSILWLIGASLTIVFQCTPVSGFWDLLEPSHCVPQTHAWIGAAVPSIAIDLVLLVVPNFWIRRLNIARSQKIGLVFIFMLGIFVTICSALRLWQLVILRDDIASDPPWATVPTGIWSMVEANLAVVCACLPTMRPLLRLVLHGKAKSTNTGPRGHSASPGPGIPLEIVTDVKVYRHWSDAEFDQTPPVSPESFVEGGFSSKPLPPLKTANKAATRPTVIRAHTWEGTSAGQNDPMQPTFSTTICAGGKPPDSPARHPSGRGLSRKGSVRQTPRGYDTSWLQLSDSRPTSAFVATQTGQPSRLPSDRERVLRHQARRSLRESRSVGEVDLDDFDFDFLDQEQAGHSSPGDTLRP